MFSNPVISQNQFLDDFSGIRLTLKREDQLHPVVSGNKFRKLKYPFLALQSQSESLVVTFGGAFSNHLAAVAAAGKALNIETIGLVRGEEWQKRWAESATLSFCQAQGMRLYFLTRDDYRHKRLPESIQSLPHTLLPEGGTSALAVRGCQEILTPTEASFNTICCCVGTGGTLAGLIQGSRPSQTVLGFPVLKHPNLAQDVSRWTSKSNWELLRGYEGGGYAKTNDDLVAFMNDFYKQYQIPLDPIYTGKMLFGIFDLIKKNQWKWGKNVLIIHSGGLQGITGFNQRRAQKGKSQLTYS